MNRRTSYAGALARAGILVLATVLSSVATGLALLLVVLQSAVPAIDGRLNVVGIDESLTIVRDGNGIPHIFAGSEQDAWFGLGFVHAQDRFTNMEFTRRAGAGRLAEALGEDGVLFDRRFRTIGYAHTARAVTEALDPATLDLLQSYADGVNAALEADHLPVELRLMGVSPEPWTPADSILAIKMMGVLLSHNARDEALRARLLQRLGEDRLRELWPPLDRLVPGSNAWAVAGRHSASGKPLLASDPHLRFAAPSIWYLAHLSAPNFSVWGATLPGIAAVPIGRNRKVAWGMTSVYADVQDLFVETQDPDDPNAYLTPDGPAPFGLRQETIGVRGGESIHLSVRSTRHGPVVSELPPYDFAKPGQVVAFHSEELATTDLTQRAAFRSLRAESAEAFREAMHELQAIVQIAVHADSDGNIGYLMTGRLPVRASGDGFLPADGTDPGHAWIDQIQGPRLPAEVNPPNGRVASANEFLAPPGYPHFIMRDHPPSYRAERLRELLDSVPAGGFTPQDFAAMQGDVVSPAARSLLPYLLAASPFTGPSAEAAQILKDWDFRMNPGRPEPLLYSAWHRSLLARLLPSLFGDGGPSLAPMPLLLTDLLTGRTPGCGNSEAACQQLVRHALAEAVSNLRRLHGRDHSLMRWDAAAVANHHHRLLGGVPILGRLFNITRPHHGGPFTLRRMESDWSDDEQPFAGIHGAGVRLVHDLNEPTRSWAVLSTGQAGNPLSPWYRDQADSWFAGQLLELETDRSRIGVHSALELVPKTAP